MERELPFPLRKYHRSEKMYKWRYIGLVFESEAEFKAIYERLIYATKCELCDKTFTKSRDRQMDHCHDTGKFRNIVCNRCNQRKADIEPRSNNTSGYKGISWNKGHNSWDFKAMVNGKQKTIKRMKDLDELIEFATKWKIDNNYHT